MRIAICDDEVSMVQILEEKNKKAIAGCGYREISIGR